MHREGAQVAGVVTRLSTTLTCGVWLSHYTLLREAAPGQARPTVTLLCTICSNCTCETVCSVLLCKMQRSCCKHQVSSSCMSILHPGMLSGPGSTQTHGLPGDTLTNPEYSTDSVDSQSHTKLSSEDVEEETKHQGSKVSNARPFTHKSWLTTHQDVSCASFSPTMQVPSEPAEGESDPHEETRASHSEGWVQSCCLSVHVGSHHQYEERWCWHVASLTANTNHCQRQSGLPVLVHSTYSWPPRRYCSKRVWVFAHCACHPFHTEQLIRIETQINVGFCVHTATIMRI